MAAATPTTVTASFRIKRAWNRLAPKVLAFFATGVSATVVIQFADTFGYVIEPGAAAAIAIVVATVAGYFKTDTALVEASTLVESAPVATVEVIPSTLD